MLALLRRVVDTVQVDDLHTPLFDATLARCLLTLDSPTALDPMRDFLLTELSDDFWLPFRRETTTASPKLAIAPPKATVEVMDMSEPAAYDARGVVRTKRLLTFQFIIEREGSAGFVVSRRWNELEMCDAALVKLFPQAGKSTAFPRVILPSPTERSSDYLCQALSAYCSQLLNDPRYSASAPVAQLLAKERTDAKEDFAAAAALTELGRGVTDGLTKTTGLATRGLSLGFNTLTSVVSSSADVIGRNSGMQASDILRKRASVPAVGELAYTPRKTPTSSVPSSPMNKVPSAQTTPKANRPASLRSENGVVTNGAVKPVRPATPARVDTETAIRAGAQITPDDLDRVLASVMSLIEEAYGASESGLISYRRTVIRLIDVTVRSFYASYISILCGTALAQANAETFATQVDFLTESFWPNGEWAAIPPPRTAEEKATAHREARELMLTLAPSALRTAMGQVGTDEAIGRLHDALASSQSPRWVSRVTIDLLRLLVM